MSDILEFLFKFRPVIFEKGELALRPLLPWYGVVLLAAAALAFAFLLYRRVEGSVGRPWRRALALIRLLPLLILMAIVLQPVLVLQAVVPQQNFLAIAYDASKSMEIKDGPGRESRLEAVEQLLLPGGGSLQADLEQKFKLRFFRFAGNVERTEGFQAGPRRGNFTDLGRALGHIAGEMGSVPLAGVILLTDGSDNRSSDLSTAVSQMRALNTPIFPIGIGSEDLGRDIEVLRVSTPPKVLKDALVEADVTVRSTGYAGRRTKILVKEGDRVLQSQEITLGGDDEVKTYKLSFTGDTVGARTLSFRAEPVGDEVVVENNDRMALIRVVDEQPKILYMEGEPRWIFAFLRRGILEDPNLHLVTLLRQADGKFLRQGIETPATLEKGFPLEKSELYQYKGLILGSTEASFFSYDQLRLISDFVSQRGGGLLMLGGKNSFGQGGYGNTPLEDVLPVVVESSQGAGVAPVDQDTEFRIRLSVDGLAHPITRLSSNESENRKRWEAAPALIGFNPTGGPKAGATVLATAAGIRAGGDDPVLLAFQYFGRGRSVALTTGSVWRWRMEQDHRDNFHELFWRQLARWLVSDTPDLLSLDTDRHSYSLEESALIRSEVHDSSFVSLNDAQVTARIKAPSGLTTSVPLDWDMRKEGSYSARFRPEEEGLYEVTADYFHSGRSLGTSRAYFRVGESSEEFHNAALNSDLLRQLASESGGRYYSPSDARNLAEDISYVETGEAELAEKELWDMPFLYLLLVGSMAAEWILRKRKGLA